VKEMADKVEITSSILDPIYVRTDIETSVVDGIKIGIGFMTVGALVKIGVEMSRMLPYLKQIAENGMQK
jgi:hypothetical protein